MMTFGQGYPEDIWALRGFYPEVKERLVIPKDVPAGIAAEFREAERCAEAGCYRASAALFRSVLDKTLRTNGYKTTDRTNLKVQIDSAADDGIISAARKARAHEDVRVFGNDVLHDEWHALTEEDVEPAHRYTQRILEDFYDDRQTVIHRLKAAGRIFDQSSSKA